MAAKTIGEVPIADTDYQRGAVFEDVNHDRITNAIRYLSYAKLYYPLEYGFFIKSFATLGATWSMEDGNFITALYEFEAHFQKFLVDHPKTEQDVNRLSPKQMVDRVNEELVQEAQARREAVRKTTERVVAESIKQQRLQLNTLEIEELEKAAGEAIRSSITDAATIQELQQIVEERITPIILAKSGDREQVAQTIRGALREDPKAIQQILLSDQDSQKAILEHTVFTPLPNKRDLLAVIGALEIKQEETRDAFLARAESVTRVAMIASSDLTQGDMAHIEPGNLLSALLADQGNKNIIAQFNKLSEQAKNAIAITVVSRSWEEVVDAITRRAGGALAPAFQTVVTQGNTQWGERSGGAPLGIVGSVISGVLTPLLNPALENYINARVLIHGLPPENKGREQSAAFALFLGAAARDPRGVRFEAQHEGWLVRLTAESAIGKVVQGATQSGPARGFFGKFLSPILGFFGIKVGGAATKVAGEGVKRGVAALLTKLGLSALAGVLTGGTSLLAQAALWVGGKALGGLWKAGAWLLSAGWLTSLLGFGSPQEGRRGPDWVAIGIAIVVGVAVLVPMFGAMMQITTQSSALFVASVLENTGGPYIESFAPYAGPFPEEAPPVASCPVSAGPITQRPNSNFTHKGICAYDFGPPMGAPVYATHNGCVANVRSDVPNNTFIEREFGNYVRLVGTSPTGHYYTTYAHLEQGSGLSVGQCKNAGDIIGYVDTTGFTFNKNGTRGGGTHLHYQYNDDQKTCPSLPAGCGK